MRCAITPAASLTLLCTSCGPVVENKTASSPDGVVELEIESHLRGASASNNYFVYAQTHEDEKVKIFESRSGSEPEIIWKSSSEIQICTLNQDSYYIRRTLAISGRIIMITYSCSG